jgi:hypothetical protein
VSRNLGWPERHNWTASRLRHLADVLEEQQREEPQPFPWSVDVVAPQQVWDRYDETWSDG